MPFQRAYDSAVVQNHDAVAHSDELVHTRRNQQDRITLQHIVVHVIINVDACADINSICWFIQNQHLAVCVDPFGEMHLLLIALA